MLTNNRKRGILEKLASAKKEVGKGILESIKGGLGTAKTWTGQQAKSYGNIVKGEGTATSKAMLEEAKAGGKASEVLAAQAVRRAELAKRTAAIGAPAALTAGGVYSLGKGRGKSKTRKKLGLTRDEMKSLTRSMAT